jgi:hypothetical protein
VARRERGKLIAPGQEKRVSVDKQRVGPLLNECCERRVDITFATGA